METVTILLPNQVGRLVSAEARHRGVDASTLCSGIIAEHFLGASPNSTASVNPPPVGLSAIRSESTEENGRVQSSFNVRKHFPRFPGLSVELAQSFVDAALDIKGTRAFPTERGIGFEPNFVFILYLRKKNPGGIGVSFYGGPDRHLYRGLRSGRNPNYSSAVIENTKDLGLILPDVRRAYDLRFH